MRQDEELFEENENSDDEDDDAIKIQSFPSSFGPVYELYVIYNRDSQENQNI